jgi:hypothetical protein
MLKIPPHDAHVAFTRIAVMCPAHRRQRDLSAT